MPTPDFLKKYVLVFDTETARLGDHIIELGFSLFKDMELVREWGMFVKPTVQIDPDASKVHHIYDKDVENSPTFKDIAPMVQNVLNTYGIHCAYNYDYDRKVLEQEFQRCGIKFPLKPMVDPMILFKKWNKFNKGKRLIDAAEKYGIPYVGAHRAMNDATVTGRLLFKIAATKPAFPKTLDKFIETQRQWIEEQFIDFSNYRKSRGQELPTPPNFSYYEV